MESATHKRPARYLPSTKRLSNLFLCHRMRVAGSLVFGVCSRGSMVSFRPWGSMWQLWMLQKETGMLTC